MKIQTARIFNTHTVTKISKVTGYTRNVITRFKQGLIPTHITGNNGTTIPSCNIMESKIIEAFEK